MARTINLNRPGQCQRGAGSQGKHAPGCRCAITSSPRANIAQASTSKRSVNHSKQQRPRKQARVSTFDSAKIFALNQKIDSLSDALAKVGGQYNVLQLEYTKMRRNVITMSMATRRAVDDAAKQDVRIDQLSAARYYQRDIINEQKKTIDKLKDEVKEQADVISGQGEKITSQMIVVDNLFKRMDNDELTINAQVAKIGAHELTIEELTSKLSQADDKIKDLRDELNECKISMDDYRIKVESGDREASTVEIQLAKDARIKSIANALETLKTNLIWGRFSGDSAELDDLFNEVQQLAS